MNKTVTSKYSSRFRTGTTKKRFMQNAGFASSGEDDLGGGKSSHGQQGGDSVGEDDQQSDY